MTAPDFHLSRRRALALTGGLLFAANGAQRVFAQGNGERDSGQASGGGSQQGELPVDKMEQALGAKGRMHKGVLDITIGRKDIGNVPGPMNVSFSPAFTIHHDMAFQSIQGGHAMMNGELALLPHEIDKTIAAIVQNDLTFQAEHQHIIGLTPQIWHIHFRGRGEPVQLMQRIKKVLQVTATPLPQMGGGNKTSPLDHQALGRIVGGHAEVGDGGVVTVAVPRKERIRLGGIEVNPLLGVMSHVSFMPIQNGPQTAQGGGGTNGSGASGGLKAAVVPDYAMLASEVDPLMRVALSHGFQVHCLYNQETDEHPQLYFSHQLNVGDPEQMAHAVHAALEKTNVEFS